MSLLFHKRTMAEVLGDGMPMSDHSTTFDEATNTYKIYADDSIVSDHLCQEMAGARVGIPKTFEGSGLVSQCPFCNHTINVR